MEKHFSTGLMLAIAALLFLAGCTTDNALQDATQVNNLKEVNLSLFEKTEEALPSRANDGGGTSLAASKLFSELEVVMIPQNNLKDTTFITRQFSTDSNFGQVRLYVPVGSYYMVAAAANTDTPNKKKCLHIKSTSELVFPNDDITDMAYLYEPVTISKDNTSLSYALSRGVAAFTLNTVDHVPSTAKTLQVTFSQRCGKIFDPSKGYCTQPFTIVKTYDLEKHRTNTIDFTIYLLLTNQDVKDMKLEIKALDESGTLIKTTSFDDVHLVRGKRTSYRGPLFTSGKTASFSITQSKMEEADPERRFE